ncbi:MAG: wax ester/triacylglycerol synthase domain-containing protein [Myxococcota bacterium]
MSVDMSNARAVPRLSGQDLAFLAFETRRRPMHIAVRASFELPLGVPAPTLSGLRAIFARAVAREPALQRRLLRSWFRKPRWGDIGPIDVARHIRSLRVDPKHRARDVDVCLRAPLDRDLPLWEIWLLDTPERPRTFELLLKVHQVLIDSVGAVALFERLLESAPVPTLVGRGPGPELYPDAESLGSAANLAHDPFRSTDRTALNGGIAEQRHRRLDVPSASFDRAARRLGGSRNDLLLSVVTGTLQRWFAHSRCSFPMRLRAFCPVSPRPRDSRAGFGNRISPWFVPLPMDEPTLAGRVARVNAATRAFRRKQAEGRGNQMARWVQRLGGWVARLGMAIANYRRDYNLIVTSARGPRALSLLGAHLRELTAFAPLVPGQRVAVAVVEYEGRLFFGVTEGWKRATRGRRLMESLAEELTLLERSALRDDRADSPRALRTSRALRSRVSAAVGS